MDNSVSEFFKRHSFDFNVDVLENANGILEDMHTGLSGKKACQDMIRTFCNPQEEAVKNKSVIVIDAGGTNFRSCLVTFDDTGLPVISEMEKTRMPGVEKELSKKEFFTQFADNLEHLKNKAENIGFCFSYPMTITENGDGILLGFSKEVKAPEVVGCEIGKCLKEELESRGWNEIKKITLCNDTVAALLAGKACAKAGDRYSSYIGYILGTGMNAAYVQPEDEKFNIKKQIVVCESGKYLNVKRSDFDVEFDASSTKPGTFFLEKLCSGAYLGPVSGIALKKAAEEKLFSQAVNDALLKIKDFTLIEMDKFLHAPYDSGCILGNIACTIATTDDVDKLFQILDAIAARSAKYAAAILIACAVQTGAGKSASMPVCMLCDGTTFHKTYMVKERTTAYLDEILTGKLGIYWRIVSCDNDITLGAAIAGLI